MNADLPYKVTRRDGHGIVLKARFADSVYAVAWAAHMLSQECNICEWQVVNGNTGLVFLHNRWFDGQVIEVEVG